MSKVHLNQILKREVTLPKPLLKRLRELVRSWYGSLSVNELTNNSALVAEISAIEALFGKGLAV